MIVALLAGRNCRRVTGASACGIPALTATTCRRPGVWTCQPVGRLYLGFVVDKDLAEEFQSMTGLEVSFVATGGDRAVVASTLATPRQETLA